MRRNLLWEVLQKYRVLFSDTRSLYRSPSFLALNQSPVKGGMSDCLHSYLWAELGQRAQWFRHWVIDWKDESSIPGITNYHQEASAGSLNKTPNPQLLVSGLNFKLLWTKASAFEISRTGSLGTVKSGPPTRTECEAAGLTAVSKRTRPCTQPAENELPIQVCGGRLLSVRALQKTDSSQLRRFWQLTKRISPDQLPREFYQACLTGQRSQGRPRTHLRD